MKPPEYLAAHPAPHPGLRTPLSRQPGLWIGVVALVSTTFTAQLDNQYAEGLVGLNSMLWMTAMLTGVFLRNHRRLVKEWFVSGQLATQLSVYSGIAIPTMMVHQTLTGRATSSTFQIGLTTGVITSRLHGRQVHTTLKLFSPANQPSS